MFEKLKSRKLVAAVLTGGLIFLNGKFGLGLSEETIRTLTELAMVYLASQGFADAFAGVSPGAVDAVLGLLRNRAAQLRG